jgi:sporulation protein YlmC with PRC-barrel domain
VVSTGGQFGKDVLVPRAALEEAARDGDAIWLDVTREELEQQPEFVATTYTNPPPFCVPPAGFAWPHTAYAWPAAYPFIPDSSYLPPAEQTAGESERQRERDLVTVNKGALVLDQNGEDLGVVDDVLLEPRDGQLEGFMLRFGGTLRTLFGDGETVRVGRDLVDTVGDGVVRLRADKHAIRQRAA